MFKRQIIITALGGALFAGGAIAQSAAPTPTAPTAPSAQPGAPSATPAPSATTQATPVEANLAAQGKWRASKLMGVDIYGPDDKKVGDVTEVVFDKSGKVEIVTVGVGGFLGIGAKDVAIPFDQVTWSDRPMVTAAPSPAPTGGTVSPTAGTPPAAAAEPGMYPDHGKISMTKEQLAAAPAVRYAAR